MVMTASEMVLHRNKLRGKKWVKDNAKKAGLKGGRPKNVSHSDTFEKENVNLT